jgi:hypothetical protein
MHEIIIVDDAYKHPNRDYTWEMDDCEIEDKIKELRKEIYKLQNSRKNQPFLAVFRKEKFNTGELQCHIFRGFKIMDEKENLLCADNWIPITDNEAQYLKQKYKLSDLALKIIKDTIKKGDEK